MVLKRNNSNPSGRRRNVKSRLDKDYCSTPATVVDKLNDDLLGEILIRLPLKTVIGFKVINKRWYSFISDPHFTNKLTSRQTNPDISTFFSECSTRGSIVRRTIDRSSADVLSETIISLDLPEAFAQNRGAIISASCHGLLVVLLRNYDISFFNFFTKEYDFSPSPPDYICIFNPLTKKKQLIPCPPNKLWQCCSFGLVFGPITSSSPYYHNHYNVVCLYGGRESFSFKVFNPKKGCWIDSDKSTRINYGSNGLKQHWVNLSSNTVFLRGIVLWLCNNGVIIAFNADKDESKIIQIPSIVSEIVVAQTTTANWLLLLKSFLWLGVVEDEVNLVFCTPKNEVFIWVLDDYETNKWKLKRNDVINREIKPLLSYMKPIFFDGERLVVAHPMSYKSCREEHNIRTGISRSLCVPDGPLGFHYVSTLTEVSRIDQGN